MDRIAAKPAMTKKYRDGDNNMYKHQGLSRIFHPRPETSRSRPERNSGIGWHTVVELARAGSEVIVAARSEAKGRDVVGRFSS